MPKILFNRKMRKVNMTITVPEFIADALDESGFKSDIVNRILEENLDRIMDGDVNKAKRFREEMIENDVMEALNTCRIKIESSRFEQVNKVISTLTELRDKVNDLKMESRDIFREANNLVIELRSARQESVDGMRDKITEITRKAKSLEEETGGDGTFE